MNSLLYHTAMVQAGMYPPAQAYLARRQREGRTGLEARRALKRYLARRIRRQWQACWPSAPAAAAA